MMAGHIAVPLGQVGFAFRDDGGGEPVELQISLRVSRPEATTGGGAQPRLAPAHGSRSVDGGGCLVWRP